MSLAALSTAGAVLLALGLSLSIAGVNIGLALLTLAAFWRLRREGSRAAASLREPLLAAVLVYALWGQISAANALDPASAMKVALKDWHKVWTLAVLLLTLDLADERPCAAAAGLGAAAAAALGFYQVLTGPVDDQMRAHGTVHPVTYGGLMAFAALAAAIAASFAGRKAERAAAAAVGIACCVALALSQTRSALLALLAGAAAAALMLPRLRPYALKAGAGVVVAALAVIVLIPARGRESAAIFSPFGIRSALWRVAWDAFLARPWTGLGPGGYGVWYAARGPVLDNQAVWTNAHNIVVHQAAERGLPGLLALFGVLGTAVAGLRRPGRARTPAGAAAVACTAAFLVLNLFETSFQTEQAATAFLAVWAWARTRPSAEMVS